MKKVLKRSGPVDGWVESHHLMDPGDGVEGAKSQTLVGIVPHRDKIGVQFLEIGTKMGSRRQFVPLLEIIKDRFLKGVQSLLPLQKPVEILQSRFKELGFLQFKQQPLC